MYIWISTSQWLWLCVNWQREFGTLTSSLVTDSWSGICNQLIHEWRLAYLRQLNSLSLCTHSPTMLNGFIYPSTDRPCSRWKAAWSPYWRNICTPLNMWMNIYDEILYVAWERSWWNRYITGHGEFGTSHSVFCSNI